MGKGWGKGGAQLGKAVKGKSKERKKVERGTKKPEDAKDGMLGRQSLAHCHPCLHSLIIICMYYRARH
jgi:hypothetical protein